MSTSSWLDPSTRQARLLTKDWIQRMPGEIHKLPLEQVNQRRWEGCDFIMAITNSLSMFSPAQSCAVTLFNRFYSRNGFNDRKPQSWSSQDWNGFLPHPYQNLSWRFVAVACLFVAGKIEDNPKKIADVVKSFHAHWPASLGILTEDLTRQLKGVILAYERLVLMDMEFDMIVEAPVAFNQVLHFIKLIGRPDAGEAGEKNRRELNGDNAEGGVEGTPLFQPGEVALQDLSAAGQSMVTLAIEFVKESLYTTLWLQYDAPTIALGMVHLTAKYYNYGGAPGWWRQVQRQFREVNTRKTATGAIEHSTRVPSAAVLDDIGEQMMVHFRQRAPPPSSCFFPPLPEASTGLGGAGDSYSDPTPFLWRSAQLTAHPLAGKAGRSKGGVADRRVSPAPPDPPNAALEAARPAPGGGDDGCILSRSGTTRKCTCFAWRALEDLQVEEAKRTCRCLAVFCGWKNEVDRVGKPNAEYASKVDRYVQLKRAKQTGGGVSVVRDLPHAPP